MRKLPTEFPLTGLRQAPSQVWGSVRLVPLLRDDPPGDLRLVRRKYREDQMIVALERGLFDGGLAYSSYVPHGLIADWSSDGQPITVTGTQVAQHDGKRLDWGICSLRISQRMVKREAKNRLRMLPLHVAMEGFLQLHFGGPDIAWPEYSRRALASGLSPRVEETLRGECVPGLEAALRVFEIHERQVGVLVFVADALASAFVVSHPDDYRELHATLVQDFYGELMFYYGLYGTATSLETMIDEDAVESLDDLARAIDDMRSEWAGHQANMTGGLFSREVQSQQVYDFKPFALYRFMTDLDPNGENHLGEAIMRRDGTLEYLKTYRLSAAQTRRAFLLSQLAAQGWDLTATAESFNQTHDQLVLRLEKAGFGYLLKEHVLRAARNRRRR